MINTNQKASCAGATMTMALLFLVILPIQIVVNGWMLTKLWAWFIIPHYEISQLSFGLAMMIAVVVKYLTKTDTSDLVKKEDTKTIWERLGVLFLEATLQPLVILAVAKMILWLA